MSWFFNRFMPENEKRKAKSLKSQRKIQKFRIPEL